MVNISLASSILHVAASLCAESNAPVYIIGELAAKSTVGARRAARIVLGDVIVQKVSAEVGNAPALLLDVNVIQMFAGTAG